MSAIVPPRLDRGEQIARRGLAKALPFAQGRLGLSVARAASVKMSAGVLISPSLKKSSICLSPSPSMSKALREQKCLRPSTAWAAQTRRPVQRRTTSASPVFSSISRNAAEPQTGQTCREHVGLCAARPLVEHDFENLRDDVAGALHDDRVADAHVLARDLVLVVQRRVGDDDAADRDRLQLGDRRQRAGAADLDLDRLDDRRRPLGGEFVRDRPARAARDEAEPLLQREVVDLVDDAVDVVAERRALRLDRAVMRRASPPPNGRAGSAD